MKIMNAVSYFPSPKLTGIIQFDDTYLREDQKASRNLDSPFPSDFDYKREPRYGRVPSLLGVRGNEYVAITCAIDNTGHAVCRILSCGIIPEDIMYDFITEHTEGIAYACTDADKTYKNVFKAMKIAHYVKPSNYLKIIKNAGYEQPSKTDKTISIQQIQQNNIILEKLWNDDNIDKIFNRGEMTYNEFEIMIII